MALNRPAPRHGRMACAHDKLCEQLDVDAKTAKQSPISCNLITVHRAEFMIKNFHIKIECILFLLEAISTRCGRIDVHETLISFRSPIDCITFFLLPGPSLGHLIEPN